MTEPAKTDAPAPRKKLFSTGGWIFIAVCALSAPLLLGIWPTSFSRFIAYFMIAWMAAFFAGAGVMVFGPSRKDPSPQQGSGDNAPPQS